MEMDSETVQPKWRLSFSGHVIFINISAITGEYGFNILVLTFPISAYMFLRPHLTSSPWYKDFKCQKFFSKRYREESTFFGGYECRFCLSFVTCWKTVFAKSLKKFLTSGTIYSLKSARVIFLCKLWILMRDFDAWNGFPDFSGFGRTMAKSKHLSSYSAELGIRRCSTVVILG